MEKLWRYIRSLFNIGPDSIEPQQVIQEITAGVRFRGKTLWILIFAIFIASLGLNVNSTAVIIGAMLISPLMGPIMGIGLGLGINDLQLLKDAARNYLVAVFMGLLTSTVYFSISPVTGNPSELLARTTPTVYDVMIAFFGGLAGIVATNSKDNRGNVIPGVAIATALMPPLCTAGFGLSQGNIMFFLGAFYLLFINTVFICLATYLIVRLLKFPYHFYPNSGQQVRIRNLITVIAILTIIPSVLIAYRMISKDIFERNADRFVEKEMVFPGIVVINKTIDYPTRTILVSLFGRKINDEELVKIKRKLPAYRLDEAHITVDQELSDSISDLSGRRQLLGLLNAQSGRLEKLEERVSQPLPILEPQSVYEEAKAAFPGLNKISITSSVVGDFKNHSTDTVLLGCFTYTRLPAPSERQRLENWMKSRFRTDQIEVVITR